MTILKGERITKSFGEQQILRDVTVAIEAGEFVAIMGPSGSGKSTLLFALSGMDRVTSGDVVFDGESLAELKEPALAEVRRTKMGFIFQQPTMLKTLNIVDNIVLPAMRDNRKNSKALTTRAYALMQQVGIEAVAQHAITDVSGGQLQRAGICRALMNEPKMLFGDEPTGALNSQAAHEVMDIFTDVNAKGTTVLLVTHDANVAARTERILFMRDGEIAEELHLPKYRAEAHEERVATVTEHMLALHI